MATSSDTSDQNNVKSRRPAESAFKQQRLPAWQPILTAGTVLPTFFVLGIAFIPVGIGLLYFSDEVKEHIIDYTSCVKKDEAITCADYIKQMSMSQENKCICEMDFNLTEDFQGDVFFYYGLSNFYQNHRRYVKSRDDEQLLGRLDRAPSSDCEPFATHQDKPIAPCGAIANSLFNDTLSLYSVELQQDVPVLRTGIAWNSDKNIKFRNPDLTAFNGSLQAAFANYTKPKNWAVNVWELDLNDPNNNGFQNEDLIVWMRTAALPTFRKLYRRVDHSQPGFQTGLGKGPYTLRITYNYPVTEFDGTKSFVISTTSLLGGKNPFLGVAYIVVGTLCLLLGIVLLIIHVRCSKRFYPIPTDSFFVGLDNTLPHGMSPRIRMYSEDLDMRPPPGKITQSKMLFFEDNLEDEDANILEHDETVEPKTEKVDADDESPLFPVEIEFKASKTGKRQSETEDGKAFKTHARFTESAKELPHSRVASTSRLSTSSFVDASQAIPSSSRDQTTTPNPHKHKTFKERIRSISKIFSSKDIHEKAKQGPVDQTDSVPMANTLNSTVDAQKDRLTSDKTVQAGKAKIENLTDTEIIELEKPTPNKQTSDTVRQSTSDTVKQTTDSKGLTSDTVQQSHNTDDKTSDTVKLVDRTSDANGQTPDKAKQTPNVKGETPDKANREPDTDVQTTDSEISKTDTNNTEPDSENKDKKA